MTRTSGRRSFSLRKRVAWSLLPPMALLLLLNAIWFYAGATDASNRAYDRSLIAALKSVAGSIHASGGDISVDIPYPALDIFDERVQEHVYYAIVGPDGNPITGYGDLPQTGVTPRLDEPLIIDASFRQQPVRLAIMAKRLYDPELSGGDTVTVFFAETTEARQKLAFSLFLDSLRPQLLLIGVGLVLVVMVLRTSFGPLLDLRDAIRQRREEDLTPMSLQNVPNELSPLIEAINGHMARLDRLLQARRRFLTDAAHQIRTPLTVLGTQAEYGHRQNDPEEMRRTFRGLIETIRSTRRMANQMLTLARAEPAHGQIQEISRLDFAELAQDVAGELATLAINKNIEFSFDRPDGPALIVGNPTLLREMVSNLVDNALRYTPENGHVTLNIVVKASSIVLRVVDDGPGIPESEREKVFQRFYRILGQGDSEGSGLGLAIVREICWSHGGKIKLRDGREGIGLVVEVTLPLAPA